MKKVTPVNGNIVLKEVEESEQMAGNIYLPDMGKEKPLTAEVLKVSKTYNFHKDTLVNADVNPGDIVVVPRMGSQKISVDTEDYILCKATDIIAVIK